ncbi:uncharacterized protein L3040_006729 [Drepanopeziza brunnea f. sp. 'multigermtubi']|uniref:uncharacterized protein n=1 Tax=Drepanopeziza brunnea f. sp. 'multigermtubi' TaxID=698441 RepID=UPI00239A51A3|nr:hypothetical protein L3040_006729 [Drepanopeziza brunnea f. sp. 'multigermtubi']
MPPRRSHRKSHNGCLQCKRRHVKCDEIRPRCGPCTKRELGCHFQTPQVEGNGVTSHDQGLSESYRERPPGPMPARTLELKLWHHFVTETYSTFIPGNERQRQAWRLDVPTMALDNAFLLDAMFAVSALHLVYLEVGTKKQWLQSALRYQDLALAGLNQAISSMDNETCEPVAICSILVFMLSIAVPGVCDDANETSRDPIADILGIRKLLEGVTVILQQSEATLSTGVLKDFFLPMYAEFGGLVAESPNGGELALEEALVLKNRHLCAPILESLMRLGGLMSSRVAHRDEIMTACQSLEKLISPLRNVGAVLSWPLGISPVIFELLGQDDELAAMLFIHYGMILHLLDDWWFTKNGGKLLVRAILSRFFHSIDESWRPTIEWAKNFVGLVG